MLETPYVGGTLEQTPEMLTVSLAGTDCILLVEACVCMALTARQEDHGFEAFCDNLRQFRYRKGQADGYAGRIHYTSEWIQQAESDLAREMSRSISGIPLNQDFSYMSVHADTVTLLWPEILSLLIVLPQWRKNSAKENIITYPRRNWKKIWRKYNTGI